MDWGDVCVCVFVCVCAEARESGAWSVCVCQVGGRAPPCEKRKRKTF